MDIVAFFKQINPIKDWMEMEAASAYQKVPDSWWVMMTDIKGSTKAIADGRYKDVNTLGVCAIISVQNKLKSDQFPFIFGGDGATILVSDDCKNQALEALSYTRKMAKEQFGLTLRVFSIQVSELKKRNRSIDVAVLENQDKQKVFLFRGGGISLAEGLMKNQPELELPANYPAIGSHEGLECRWNPIPSNRGSVVSFIINPTDNSSAIEGLLSEFQQILRVAQPVQAATLPIQWPPKHLRSEAQAKGKGFFFRVFVSLYILLLFPLIKMGKKSKGSAVDLYLHQLQNNTDFVKRDDSLKLVLDLTASEKATMLARLEQLSRSGQIVFGYHESTEALMTCMVRSSSNHFHFVDGSDGGYTRASVMIKNSKKSS